MKQISFGGHEKQTNKEFKPSIILVTSRNADPRPCWKEKRGWRTV